MEEEKEWYDIAQICLNGHITNYKSIAKPEKNVKYCTKCGAKTITECQHCNTPIRGYHHRPRTFTGTPKEPPKYCHKCSKPYPWAES